MKSMNITGEILRIVPYANLIVVEYACANKDSLWIHDEITLGGTEYLRYKSLIPKVKIDGEFVSTNSTIVLYKPDGIEVSDELVSRATGMMYAYGHGNYPPAVMFKSNMSYVQVIVSKITTKIKEVFKR